jgi:hypothetical protein
MSRKRWPMMAAVFAAGAAVGAAGVTAMERRTHRDGFDPATIPGPKHERGEPLLGQTHDDAYPNNGTPGLAMSMGTADGSNATTSSPTGV